MNFVILTGRLTKDPEIRYATKDNMAVATFTLAVDNFHGEKTADFFKCICFKKTAERIDQYCVKGSALLIAGEIHDNNWSDRDGKKHYDKQVVVNSFQFMGEKKANGTEPAKPNAFEEIADDEELPF